MCTDMRVDMCAPDNDHGWPVDMSTHIPIHMPIHMSIHVSKHMPKHMPKRMPRHTS